MLISKKWLRVSNIALAVLLLALLVLQFMPFWTMPACTCSGSCADKFTADSSCEACSVYFKWCQNLDPSMHTGLKVEDIRDTSKEWSISIQHYTWLPTFESTKGITEYFGSIFNTGDYEFMVKDMATMPVIVFFFVLIGVYFGFMQSTKPLGSIFGLVAGILATVTYLTAPIFQMGTGWQIHLGVSIAIIVVALVPTVEYIARAAHWLNPKAH